MKRNHSVIFRLFNFYIAATMSLLAFTACSERDDTVQEYADWKNKNEQFFEAAYLSDDYDLKLKKYSLGTSYVAGHTDYVLVDKLGSEMGAPEVTPYLSDTVQIHYVGRLIPSPSYSTGYQFDQSYLAPFDIDTAVPSKFAVSAVVPGFGTALMQMHRGDYWLVVVPYQLGYGTSENGTIPAYSTLIFEVRLEDFWTKEKGDRY
jgi:FKBP-type peptidyl-prolyl cis-trans isomerase FklB